MKFNCAVPSNPRKVRKAVYTATANQRARLMSARLSKELREKYGVTSVPIHKEDEVKVLVGHNKTTGKVTAVRRARYVINIDKLTRTKANGQAVPIPVRPSNVEITKLFLNKDREEMLKRKGEGRKAIAAAAEKKNEAAKELFKKEYPALEYDIFAKKVEGIKEKRKIRVQGAKIADRAMPKAMLKGYKKGLKAQKARKSVAAYKAALAKKIAK